MAKSLQDQLLGAGLVDKKKAKNIAKEKRNKRKQTPKGTTVENESQARIAKQQQEKVERDRELNKKLKEEQDRKAIKAQINQLVKLNQIERDVRNEEEFFQFAVDKKIKKIFVSTEQKEGLAKGRLAIAMLDNDFYVIPASVASKILERDESNTIVYQYDGKPQALEEDDPYKDFVVPDDLMW